MSKINFYQTIKSIKSINPHYDTHGISVPFRMLIAAPSGAGKTHALANMIYAMDKTFHEIIICVLSADEPLYQMIGNRLGDAVKFYEAGEVPSINEYSIIDAKTGMLKRKDKYQRLIVFDDLIMNKSANKSAAEYYIKARKLGFSSVYIGQSYFQIPKMIRDNCQMFVLGRNLLKKDLKMILSVFPTEMSIDEFTNLYKDLANENLDVCVLDIAKRTIKKNMTGDTIRL